MHASLSLVSSLTKRPVIGCQKNDLTLRTNHDNAILQIRLLSSPWRENGYSRAPSKTPPCGGIVESKSDRLIYDTASSVVIILALVGLVYF
ncbi:Uncharacterized protein TCM_017310 [Theobroma cacao]|uniref:Uncharacterized protein n=1 Tax=Theobroma cacao TaxID=3641 RepID=A0A061EDA2_THECC|nr:Uncharacterized protein TCM_017310 [Theobroma cacao]